MRLNGVNSGKAKKREDLFMPILSQAGVGLSPPEGAETTKVSPNNNPSHERPTLDGMSQKTYLKHKESTMPKGKFWTEKDIEWLKGNYFLFGSHHCARILKRSPAAIVHKASRLGLLRKGGERLSRLLIVDGYIWVSERGERYAIHRRLMEMKLGRKLNPTEIVHHVDGNRMNNALGNLQLTTISEHNYVIHPKERDPFGRFCQVDDIVRTPGKPGEVEDKEPS